MVGLLDKAVESFEGEPVCNVSDETNEWNRVALEYVRMSGGSLGPLSQMGVSAKEIKKRQEGTYK